MICFLGLSPSVCAALIMKAYVTVPTLNDGMLIVTACYGILQTTLRLTKLLNYLCVRVSFLIWVLLEMTVLNVTFWNKMPDSFV